MNSEDTLVVCLFFQAEGFTLISGGYPETHNRMFNLRHQLLTSAHDTHKGKFMLHTNN